MESPRQSTNPPPRPIAPPSAPPSTPHPAHAPGTRPPSSLFLPLCRNPLPFCPGSGIVHPPRGTSLAGNVGLLCIVLITALMGGFHRLLVPHRNSRHPATNPKEHHPEASAFRPADDRGDGKLNRRVGGTHADPPVGVAFSLSCTPFRPSASPRAASATPQFRPAGCALPIALAAFRARQLPFTTRIPRQGRQSAPQGAACNRPPKGQPVVKVPKGPCKYLSWVLQVSMGAASRVRCTSASALVTSLPLLLHLSSWVTFGVCKGETGFWPPITGSALHRVAPEKCFPPRLRPARASLAATVCSCSFRLFMFPQRRSSVRVFGWACVRLHPAPQPAATK